MPGVFDYNYDSVKGFLESLITEDALLGTPVNKYLAGKAKGQLNKKALNNLDDIKITEADIPTELGGNQQQQPIDQSMLFDKILNKNIKSMIESPDGTKKVDFHDDSNLVTQMLGLPMQQVQPRSTQALPPATQGQQQLQPVDVPQPDTSGGGAFDFLGDYKSGNALAMLLGGIAQALGGNDPRVPGVGLGQLAQQRAQSDIFGQLFDSLLQQNGGSDFSFKPR